MWKTIVIVLFVLYILYLIMALGQAFGIIKFTNRKITTGRMLIPFYFWIVPSDEKKVTPKREEKKNTLNSTNIENNS